MHGEDVREVLREAARASESAAYPTEDLIRFMESGLTIDKVIKEFIQSGGLSVEEA